MLTQYPSPATAVKVVVLISDCQDVPPAASTKDKFPEPSVFNNWSAEPSAFGYFNPSKTTFPSPLGVIVKSIFVSSPIALISGALEVAAFLICMLLTAAAVFEKINCSFDESSKIPLVSSTKISFPLVSKFADNCGVVSED